MVAKVLALKPLGSTLSPYFPSPSWLYGGELQVHALAPLWLKGKTKEVNRREKANKSREVGKEHFL